MPENIKLYLDQMLQAHIARVLRDEGFNLIRVNSPQLAAKGLFLIDTFDTP